MERGRCASFLLSLPTIADVWVAHHNPQATLTRSYLPPCHGGVCTIQRERYSVRVLGQSTGYL